MGPIPPAIKAELLASDAYALVAVINGLSKSFGAIPAAILRKTMIPCLVYAGEADPVLEAARESAKLIPTATFFVLPGLSHPQGSQRSDLVLPRLKEFLEKVNIKERGE